MWLVGSWTVRILLGVSALFPSDDFSSPPLPQTVFKKLAHFVIPRKSLLSIRPLQRSAVVRSLRFRNPNHLAIPPQSNRFPPINQASSAPTKPPQNDPRRSNAAPQGVRVFPPQMVIQRWCASFGGPSIFFKTPNGSPAMSGSRCYGRDPTYTASRRSGM
jgi:hypothetical protein